MGAAPGRMRVQGCTHAAWRSLQLGTVLAAPTILDVSGGLLRGFGEAMSSSPTRTGGLGRLALHQPDTVAGKLAGRLKWLDKPVEYAGRATAGAAVGAGPNEFKRAKTSRATTQRSDPGS